MPNQPKQNSDEKPRIQRSKILRIVSSALIAFILWFYVISEVRTEIEVNFSNVQVVFEGAGVLEDRKLKLVSETDLEVDLKLSGPRFALNGLRSSDLTVRVDLTGIYEAGTRGMTYDIIYPNDVSTSDIEVVSRTPDTIKVTVVSWAEKRINVQEPVITGTPAEGFRLGAIDSDDWSPKSIKIGGPREVVERIQSAGLVVDVQGITESKKIQQSFVYYDSDGNPVEAADTVTTSPENGEILIPVLMERDVAMKLPLNIDKNALDTEFTITTSVTLTDGTTTEIVGSIVNTADGLISESAVFEGLEGGQIYMNLGNVLAYGSLKGMDYVAVAQLPELSLSDVLRKEYSAADFDIYQDGNTCDVQSILVTVETREMVTRDFDVTIQNENVYPALTFTGPVGGLKVTVKGFAEDLDKISAQDLIVLIPTGAKAGERYDLEVSFREEHPELTIVEVPTVKASTNVNHLGNGQQT